MKRYLGASEVAELAELLEDAPVRAGIVDEVLQAAAERRGMTLNLRDATDTTAAVLNRVREDRQRR